MNLLNSKLSTVLTIILQKKKLIQTRISSKKVQIFNNETTRSGFMRNFKVIIFEIFGPNLNVPSKIEKYIKFYIREPL